MKYFRRFIRVCECYSFNSIFQHRKIDKILPKCILFLQNMILNRAIRSISYDSRQILLFKFSKNLLSLGILSTNVKCVLDAYFSKKNLLLQLKKWRDDPEIPKKLFFCFILGLKISMLNPNIWDCPLNPTFNF